VNVVNALWKQVQVFRDLSGQPEYLLITAWGRQFRVMPSRPLRRHPGVSAEVTVEVVGPAISPNRQVPSPLRVLHVEVSDHAGQASTEVHLPATADVVELVYEHDDEGTEVSASRAALCSAAGGDADDEVTAVRNGGRSGT
jgi:hypothetical protein